MQVLFGTKTEQTQKFLVDGRRIPVTVIAVSGNTVVSVKTEEKDKYTAVQLGIGQRKKANQALLGHSKKANLEKAPRILKEIRSTQEEVSAITIGSVINVADVFKPGDIINVTGVSKGKGWAGGVRRYHFKGGPKTHGQSDRHRAPGSIGQTTTPGRVYKGKRMAGRMGQDQVTVKNLEVVDVIGESLYVKGLIPGALKSIVRVEKTGEKKQIIALHKLEAEVVADSVQVEAIVEEIKPEETPTDVEINKEGGAEDAKS